MAVVAHTVGAALSAGAFGAALGLAGLALGAPWDIGGLVAVAVVAALYAARELLGLPVPVPERRRQVPEAWRWRLGPNSASFLYGLGLGIGFLTHVRHGTLVAVSVAAAATGDPLVGAAILAPFGLARGLSLLVLARARNAGAFHRVTERLDRWAASRWPRHVNGAVLLLMATAAVVFAAVRAGADLRPVPAAALAGVFAWAAAAKALDPRGWRESLAAHRLGAMERLALVGIPALEAAVAVLAFAGSLLASALLALALLAAFSAAIVRARALHGDRLPCGCFGRTRARDYRVLLARNLAIAGIAAVVLATGSSFPLLGWARMPQGDEVVAALLATAGLALAGWIVRRALATLRRQPG